MAGSRRPRRASPRRRAAGRRDRRPTKGTPSRRPIWEPSAEGRVIIGEVRRPWGADGSLAISRFSENAPPLESGQHIYIGGRPESVIESRRGGRGATVIRVRSIRTLEKADGVRGAAIEVDAADLPPPLEGAFYHYQVLGLRVIAAEGEELGEIVEIVATGANDVYVVKPDDPDARVVMVPALRDVVLKVDLDAGTVTVDLPDGLR